MNGETISDRLALPLCAEGLIPHRKPMRLVDTLIAFGELAGSVEAHIEPGNLLVDGEGRLDEVALAELLAQSYAVIKGYGDTLAGRPVKEGFLVGIKKVAFFAPVAAGSTLTVDIRTIATLEGFVLAEGEVSAGGRQVAAGEIKLYIPGEGKEIA